MVDAKIISEQLRRIGCDYAVWGRSEINELGNILMDDEQITQAVNGYYDGGFALVCVTNYRVLIVDKKPLTLTVEDLRYDMIAEVDFSSRVFSSVLHIYTPMRTLIFTSWSSVKLRKSMNYIQQRVMELRNNEFLAAQFAMAQGAARAKDKRKMPKSPARQSVPEMVATPMTGERPVAEFDDYKAPQRVVNPYTKVPLLSRRRKYPSFY
ncbi:PH domain-containing protein [Candidatus Saccharibacteria bacterium]|nr:PH domain-containing protein [Candidatus Saccharibacteria bacterium]